MQGEGDTDWYGPDAATFGDRIAGAREATGMSQAQLARRLGIKKSTLVGWEQDLSEPRANKLQMISGLLNVSIPWLLTGQGEGARMPGAPGGAERSSLIGELFEVRETLSGATERLASIEDRLRRLEAADEVE
ncbi:helix-turn-helix domain-containing protein [Chachezhania antarctica]|uniref:helix-turn-helix domain-containing protein n=1 Tax=Chachezhania antarctica TaxID=2340860 RepID=UPI000EAE273C|nr:helix-turn-helix transcriptional regulator [Chachezhania antarctica]|tara:strand:- start:14735 stop:15133 length:399 start_codon:yes stop_codon:yes gene_type:complete